MTYRGFHAIYTLPLLVLLALLARPWEWGGVQWGLVGGILAVVMVFTAPWDNYAVKHGIWEFDPAKVWRRIRYLPVEEYAFFWIQSLQVIFLTDWVLGWRESASVVAPAEPGFVAAGVLVSVTAGVFWRWRKRFGIGTRGAYAWHLLAWFVPLILLQWAVGWGALLPRWEAILVPVVVIGSWLVYADFKAVRAGVWFFDERQITGHKLWGVLPWEEIAFFYLTSLLVAQTWVVLLPEGLR